MRRLFQSETGLTRRWGWRRQASCTRLRFLGRFTLRPLLSRNVSSLRRATSVDRRAQFRNEHLKLAWEAQARGELVLAGALTDPVDGAVLLFQCDSSETAERFAAADPYMKHGLVTGYRVRPWTTIVGKNVATPVMPEVYHSGQPDALQAVRFASSCLVRAPVTSMFPNCRRQRG